MKSYNQLFEKRFYESKIIDETFSKIFNEKGVDSSIDYLKSIGATRLDIDNYQIRDRISNWTQDNFNEEEKEKSLKELLKIKDYVIDIKIEENNKIGIPEVSIQTTDGLVCAMKFSAYMPKIKK